MLQKMPLEESPWWSGQVLNKRPIILNTLDDLPPQIVQERNILDAQNIRSLMVVPMMSTESVYGYMGIDMVRESVTGAGRITSGSPFWPTSFPFA